MKRILVAALLAAPGANAEPDPAAGSEVFRTYCAACHGTDARGEGPMAKLLTTAPPDLTQLTAMNGGAFPTFRAVRQVDGRDPLLAHGGEMPLFGQLFEFPDASIASGAGQPIITAQPIADVVAWLMTVQE